MKINLVGLAGLFVVLSLVATARADVSNGGFESPPLTIGSFVTITPGTEPSGFDWTVASGSVDLGHSPITPFVQYSAYEGNQSLDLNGLGSGAIYQDFATLPGQQYQLTFAYADNPVNGGISTADIDVTDLGLATSLLNDSVAHSTSTNGPPPNGDWLIYTGNFTALGGMTRLAFASTSPDTSASGGIFLDAVSVTAVPEPSAVAIAVVGLVALVSVALRRAR